jgi:glutathione reductase (NADPH)
MAISFDLFVIGAGSGGVRAARIAAAKGLRVGIAEEYRVGGTCVIRGCVPKKLLVYAAEYAQSFADARGFGWDVAHPQLNWPHLRDAVQAEVSRLNSAYTNTLNNNGVTIFEGHAHFISANTLRVGELEITANKFIIATGARPAIPDCPGAELGITSNEIFHLETLPNRVLIAGGGYIATEFAGILNGLGVAVTQLYRGDLILKGWDVDMRTKLQATMQARGVTFHTKAIFERIETTSEGLRCHLSDGKIIETDIVMHAIGRVPNIDNLDLIAAGVVLTGNAIKVDAEFCTSQPHIYAVGDVIDKLQLTPVAIRQGHAVSHALLGEVAIETDLDNVPSAVFSSPPLASVGLTDEAAKLAGHDIRIYQAEFRPMRNILAKRDERTVCKLIVDAQSDKVLGVHMFGPDAPEIIQMAAIALKMGATKKDFDRTVAIHPTAAEEFVLMR